MSVTYYVMQVMNKISQANEYGESEEYKMLL